MIFVKISKSDQQLRKNFQYLNLITKFLPLNHDYYYITTLLLSPLLCLSRYRFRRENRLVP